MKMIDADAFLTQEIKRCDGEMPYLGTCSTNNFTLKSRINLAPTIDAKPVKHGKWECVYDDSTGETDITCSNCKNTRTVNGCFVSTDGKSCYFEDNYCPICGAKMDLEVEDV